MNIKEKLSTLWILLSLNYIWNDVFSLYFVPGVTEEAIGFTGGSWVAPFAFAVIIETAVVMVLFSRILPYAMNRWANIIVGVLHTALATWSVIEGVPEPFYAFIVTAEIVTTLLIVWYAWKWRKLETEK